MKTKICMLALFFLLMAAVPPVLVIKSGKTAPSAPPQTADESAAIAAAAALCDENSDDETVKAAVILAKTNFAAGEAFENGEDNSNKELKEKVAAVYHSNKEILTYQGKAVAVPYAACSNGFTEKGNAEYLEAVASPWDRFAGDYEPGLSCRGVSMSGIRALCAKGLSAEEALKWYLPKLTIG